MLRILLTCLAWVLFSGSALARDVFRLGDRVFTYEELAPGPELDPPLVMTTGGFLLSGRDFYADRNSAVLRAVEEVIVRELPQLLGADCELEVSRTEIVAFARWWDDQAARDQTGREDASRGRRRGAEPSEPAVLVHDPDDPSVAATAIEIIENHKRATCVARLYPDEPLGAEPILDEAVADAVKGGGDGPPVHLCLGVRPRGAIWDLIAEGQRRGILEFTDDWARNRLSSLTRPRPRQVEYQSAPCFETPPWSEVSAE